MPGVCVVPLSAHALCGVEPVAGGLPPVLVEPVEGSLDRAYLVRADVATPVVVYVQPAADHAIARGRVAHLPGHRVLGRPVQHVRLGVHRCLHQVYRRGFPEAGHERPELAPLLVLEDALRDLVGALACAAVLAVLPRRQRALDLVDRGELALPGGEVGRFHEPRAVLDASLTLRVGLVANPGRDLLLRKERLERRRLEDLAAGLLGDEHAVLVDSQRPHPAAAAAEEAVYRAAGLLGVGLVVLRAHPQPPRVPEQHAHEVHGEPGGALLLAEACLGLLSRGRGVYVVVGAPGDLEFRDRPLALEPVYEVAQRLLVAGQSLHLARIHEPLLQHVVDGAHVASWVERHGLDDRRAQGLHVERGVLPHPRVVVVGRSVHVVVLTHRLDARNLPVPSPQLVVGVVGREAGQPRLLYLLDHPVPYHLIYS